MNENNSVWDSIVGATKSLGAAYTANRETAAANALAKAQTNTANANASATILSSRNMIIAAVVLVVGIGLFVLMRRK